MYNLKYYLIKSCFCFKMKDFDNFALFMTQHLVAGFNNKKIYKGNTFNHFKLDKYFQNFFLMEFTDIENYTLFVYSIT